MCTGHFVEYLYDSGVNLVESVDVVPGGVVLNVPAAMAWPGLRSLESGTILFQAKDRNLSFSN